MNAYYTSIAGLAALLAGHAHATDVAVCTDRGRAVFELADAEAPGHVANFLCHRRISGDGQGCGSDCQTKFH